MTTPLRVVIADDEPLARAGIRARLALLGRVEVCGECSNGDEAIACIRGTAPDLAILDVQMPGASGFDVIEAIGTAVTPLIIFVTAFSVHATRAFDVRAVDYVLKPIEDARFAEAIERARRALEHRRFVADTTLPPLRITDRGRVVVLETQEIDWIQADGDYVRIFTRSRTYLVRASIGGVLDRLPARQFLRVHRSAIVNCARIRECRPEPNRDAVLVLTSGAKVRASRTYSPGLREWLGDCL